MECFATPGGTCSIGGVCRLRGRLREAEKLLDEFEAAHRVPGTAGPIAKLIAARAEIERERDQAIDALRRESVDLALAAASRLMQENLTQDKDRQLVERYLSEMGSA